MPGFTTACPPGLPDHNRDIAYLVVDWLFDIVACAVVSIRLYSRGFLTRSFGSDDFIIICAALQITIGSVFDTLAGIHGYGRHCAYLSPQQYALVHKWIAISWINAFISVFLVRTSVMLFTLRLLPRTKKKSQIIIYVAFGFNVIITLLALLSYGLQCRPFIGIWDTSRPSACFSPDILVITNQVNGALACVVDIATALVPAFLLWKVKMKKRTKLTLDIIFGLGLVTACLSIGRAASLTRQTLYDDQTWRILVPNWFNMVESKLGVILASTPALRQMSSYRRRTGTFLISASRQTPDADFGSMRHRINVRDYFWRGKRDPERAQGLINHERRRLGSGEGSGTGFGSTDTRFGLTDPEDSPLDEMDARVKQSVSHQV